MPVTAIARSCLTRFGLGEFGSERADYFSSAQRIWVLVQSLCVVVSLAMNPILVPYFQKRFANGGIGLCVAGAVSEVLMVTFGIVLSPRESSRPGLEGPWRWPSCVRSRWSAWLA